MPRIRLIALVVWAASVVALSVLYVLRPELLEPERVAGALRGSGQPVLLGYVVLNVVRAFTLVPATVLVVAGTLLFPDRPWFVAGSALGGAVASALLIYYFFDFLGLGDLFERRHAARVRRLEAQMARQGGFWLVAGWSMFPLTPTDVICYVAGTLRMPVARFAAAVALGKLPLVAFYVWATGTIVERLFPL